MEEDEPFETCTIQEARGKLHTKLQSIFDIPNKGIQTAFDVILDIINDCQTKYQSDHERLQDDNKALLRSMKAMQETSLEILESFQRRDDLYSKFESIMININQLNITNDEIKKDQVNFGSSLSKLCDSVQMMKFQMQLDSQYVSDPMALKTNNIIFEQGEILVDAPNSATSHTPIEMGLEITAAPITCNEMTLSVSNHKFSHNAQSHKTIAGRLCLLEGSTEELKNDLDEVKCMLRNLVNIGCSDGITKEVENYHVVQIDSVESTTKECTPSREMTKTTEDHLIHESNDNNKMTNKMVVHQDDTVVNLNKNDFLDHISGEKLMIEKNRSDYETDLSEINSRRLDRLEERLDAVMADILHRIDLMEKMNKHVIECSASFDAVHETNEAVKCMHILRNENEKKNSLNNDTASTATKNETISPIEQSNHNTPESELLLKDICSDILRNENENEKKNSLNNDTASTATKNEIISPIEQSNHNPSESELLLKDICSDILRNENENEKKNSLNKNTASTATKNETISPIEQTNHNPSESELLLKDICSDILRNENENTENKRSLLHKIHTEINERDESINQRISKIESFLLNFDMISSDMNLKDASKPLDSNYLVHNSRLTDDKNGKEPVEQNFQIDILHRLEGLKQVEDEMEKLSSKLAEKPDEIYIQKMLHDLEASVLRHIGNDSVTQSIVDDLRKELNERMTKEDVLRTVKQLILGTKKDLMNETQMIQNSSIMVGYKCLSCDHFHPSGINRQLAPKVNHNSLPNRKFLISSNSLITSCNGCHNITFERHLSAVSTNRLPRLTRHHSRPSTASFSTARSRKSIQNQLNPSKFLTPR